MNLRFIFVSINKKFTTKRSYTILWYLLGGISFYAQTTDTYSLASQLNQNSTDYSIEQLYLQSSKGVYETGEDLWFNGYVLDAQYFTPSTQSKTLFVQLLNDLTDQAVWEATYEIENGFVNGHIYLQDSLQAGEYILTAYSSHSFYKDTKEFYASRKLQILKNINTKIQPVIVKKDSIIQFNTFAEGGNLVSGIQSRLAFKAVNSKGYPVDVSGTLYENGTALVAFKSTHHGMGSLLFIPDSNKTYHIKLSEPDTEKSYALPIIHASGKVLQLLKSTKDYAFFKVSQTADLKKEKIYLRIQLRGIVYSIAEGILNKELTIKIPLVEIPQGIAEVTLFNEDFKPAAERLIYLSQEKKLYIKAVLDKSEYTTKEKVILKIKVTDEHKQGIVAHLGLSVFDRLYKNPQDPKSIQSHYYLSTQLKGIVFNPGYYFNKNNTDRKGALNLLLLTQGWRSYNWGKDVLKRQALTKTPVVTDHINGRLFTKERGKMISPGPQIVMAFSATKDDDKAFIETDASGLFTLTSTHLKMGSGGYLYLKPIVPSKPKIHINIMDNSFNSINQKRKTTTTHYPLARTQETEPRSVQPFMLSDEVRKLDEVFIKTKKKRVFRDKYLGKLDSLAKLSMITEYVCECGILNCPIPEHNHNASVPVEEDWYHNGENLKPCPTHNGSCGYWKWAGSSNYAQYHYPQLSETELLRKFNLASIKGYYPKKEFYKPVYDAATENNDFPDYRNTLFWNPAIITNVKGEASVEFYCSDINTLFLGIIEGVSAEGLLGAENFELFVRK